MNVFFDTEFTGLHQNTTLISLGIVAENDKTFYAEFTDYDLTQVSEWVSKNVISNLVLSDKSSNYIDSSAKNIKVKGNSEFVRNELESWLEYLSIYCNSTIEVWSDCLSYDWVLFNQLWGHAFKLPSFIYYIPFDICTMFKLYGIDPDVSREEFAEASNNNLKHNALWDAKIIKSCYDKLVAIGN